MEIKLRSSVDYHKLYEAIPSPSVLSEPITIDLKEHGFFNPRDIVMITLFIISNCSNEHVVMIQPPLDKSVGGYLEDIGLVEFCTKNLTQSVTIEAIQKVTAMPIRRLTSDNMTEYIDYAADYFKEMSDNRDLTMFNLSLAETINNVKDHAQSPIDAYAFCQYFPAKKQIKVVVGDLGIGIPNSVNNYLKKNNNPVISEIESMKWALTENRSIKSQPQNQGKGLNNLLTFVKANKSSLTLYSNNAMFFATADVEIFKKNEYSSFSGTLIEVVINIDNLPEASFEEVDFVL